MNTKTCERCGNSEAHRPKEEVRLVSGGMRLQCKCVCGDARMFGEDHVDGCYAGYCQYKIDWAEAKEREAAEDKRRWGF